MTEKQIIELAKQKGINELVVNRTVANSQSIEFENNSFVANKTSLTNSFAIHAFIEGNKISKSIARPSKKDINDILDLIIEESRFKTKELDEHPIDTSKQKYIKPNKKDFKPLTNKEAQEILKSLVKEVNSLDDRILQDNTSATYALRASKETFVSTSGTNLVTEPSNNFVIWLQVLFDDTKGVKGQSYLGKVYNNKDEINFEDLKKEVVRDIKLQEKAKKLDSGNYEIVFDQNIFMQLFNPFFMHLNARSVIDKISHWQDKIGKQVASEKINLIDKPILEKLGIYITYDADGLATSNQYFIEKGKLNKFVTNAKLAKILKTKNSNNSSGNAASFFNPIIETGKSEEKEIIESIKKGILLRNLSGLHSGLNATSGEFSLELRGNIIENGEIKEDIIGAIISGNFFTDVLNNIGLVGNKLNLQEMSSSPLIKLSKKLPISS